MFCGCLHHTTSFCSKDEQLKAKDEQIEELSKMLKAAQVQIETLQLAGTQDQRLMRAQMDAESVKAYYERKAKGVQVCRCAKLHCTVLHYSTRYYSTRNGGCCLVGLTLQCKENAQCLEDSMGQPSEPPDVEVRHSGMRQPNPPPTPYTLIGGSPTDLGN